jgi:hypothetical protein
MFSPKSSRPDLDALYIAQLVSEGKQYEAAHFLFGLHKENVLLWAKIKDYLFTIAYTNSLLNTYATLVEISSCDCFEQKAYLLPGSSEAN